MGKNEVLKTKASFWNALAIAAAVTGVIVPVIAVYGDEKLWNSTVYPPTELALKWLWPMIAGAIAAAILRGIAVSCSSQVTDD